MAGGMGLGLPEMEPAVTKTPVSILLLGAGSLGKSSALERFIRGQFGYPPPTPGVDVRFHTIRLTKSKRRVVVQLMDTSGLQTCQLMLGYLARCDAVCYLYDVTNASSFEAVRGFHELVQEHAPPDTNAILLSTKNDITDTRRQVSTAEGMALARSLGVELFETSALTGMNVKAAFEAVIKATAIRIAVGQTDVAAIEALVGMPVEPARREPAATDHCLVHHDDAAFGPLHYACLFAGANALKQLALKKGVMLDAVDSQGRTALHVAALKSRIPCARLLIATGADPRIHDKLGRTPQDLAAEVGCDEMKDMLSQAVDTALYCTAMSIARCSIKTCKLLILGPTGAGKTTLWRAIRGVSRGASDSHSFAAPRTTVQRTCVFDSSVVMLSQLQQMDDEPGTITPSPRLRTPSLGTSTTLAADAPTAGPGAQATGYDGTCWGTICLISDFFSRRAGPFRWRADERLPGSPVSRDLYTEEDTGGDVAIASWDLSGQDVSGPLQRMMVETANVVVICFDLFKAQYGRDETLRDLASIFGILDTTLPAGITNNGRVHHSIILVGTFRDALPAPEEDSIMDEISLAISRRLRSFNTFARIRVPPSSRIFYAVGLGNRSTGLLMSPSASARAGPQRQAEEVSALREAVCSSVVRSGSLRRNRPTMWLRALEEMRSIPATHVQSSGQSPFRSAIPLEQARHVADRVSTEFTGRPMEDAMFDVMLRMLAELGEVMLLPASHLVVRPEKILKIYQRLMETCMARRSTSPARRRSQKQAKDAAPAPHLEPIVQHLRTTGVVEHAHLLELLSGVEDAATLDVIVQAMQKTGLLTRDSDGLCFFPDAPLLLHEELYPFPVDSPSIYDELSGKVLCYCSFAQDAVPRGLLALLVLHGSRFRSVEVDGLRFQYRPWSRPILARDHAEIPLSGYTAALTVDHRRARISVAVSCQDGAYLTPTLEAQVGLLLYQMMEDVRKQHYARFRMDLQVVDDGRVYDFVKDVLLVHKASERRAAAAASGIGALPEQEEADLEQEVSVPHGHFDFSAEALGGGVMDLDNVVHWARVFTEMPACSYRPMPSALIHGTIASASARSAQSKSWSMQLEGCLRLLDDQDAMASTASSKALCLVPHPASNRRRSQTSAYVALRVQQQQVMSSSGEAVPDPGTIWRVEPCCGGFRVRVGEGGGVMRGWYLALSSRVQKERDQDVHAILTAEPARAMVWGAVPAPGGVEGFQLRVQWGSEWRYLTSGAKDPKHPDYRLVVVSASNTTTRWGLDIPAVSDLMNPYSMVSPLSSTGSSTSSHSRFSLITPRGLDAKAVRGIVADLLKEITSAVEDRVVALELSPVSRASDVSASLDADDDLPSSVTPSSHGRSRLFGAKSMSFTDELLQPQPTGAGALEAKSNAA